MPRTIGTRQRVPLHIITCTDLPIKPLNVDKEHGFATSRSAGIPARIDPHIAVRMTALRIWFPSYTRKRKPRRHRGTEGNNH